MSGGPGPAPEVGTPCLGTMSGVTGSGGGGGLAQDRVSALLWLVLVLLNRLLWHFSLWVWMERNCLNLAPQWVQGMKSAVPVQPQQFLW